MLNELQRSVLRFIGEQVLQAQLRFHSGEDVRNQINITAGYAFALYTDLVTSGRPIHFSETMLQNRGVSPSDPEFFRHLHALQDFVGLVNAIA